MSALNVDDPGCVTVRREFQDMTTGRPNDVRAAPLLRAGMA